MGANAFRHFYEYHFSENRKLWNFASQLTGEQFTQPVNYSHGSVRDQLVHVMSVDDTWFSELQNIDSLEPPVKDAGRNTIRVYGDAVEQRMRDYLAKLQDDMLFSKPITEPEEDKDLPVWQVLLHVANHATDHRAQVLRLLSDLGGKTAPQDYIFYIMDNM